MGKILYFILGVVCVGGVASADGESLLEFANFPMIVADASFVDRMENLRAGYEPYETQYDPTTHKCISGCAYPGLTLEEDIARLQRAERLSQETLAGIRHNSHNTSSAHENTSTQQPAIRNCTDYNANIPGGQTAPIGEPFKKLYRISSGFSPARLHPIDKVISSHNGTDIAAPHGTKIYVTAGGTVEKVFTDNKCGMGITILHDDKNFKTSYCHLSKQLVKAGQYVSPGCLIGLVGSSGAATGAHLHYVVRILTDGKYTPVDPENGYIVPSGQR